MARYNPSASFTWQRRGLLNSLPLLQSAPRLRVFSEAPSTGTLKQRLVFEGPALQKESSRLFSLFCVRADINDCRDQCQNGGTCKVRVGPVRFVAPSPSARPLRRWCINSCSDPNRQNCCRIPLRNQIRGEWVQGFLREGHKVPRPHWINLQ